MKIVSVPEDKWEHENSCAQCATVFQTDQSDLKAIDDTYGRFYVSCPTCGQWAMFSPEDAKSIPYVTQMRVRKKAPRYYPSSDW